MNAVRDGEVITLDPCGRCKNREHSLSFAESRSARIFATCAACGRTAPISLDRAYAAMKNLQTPDDLADWLRSK